MSQLLDRCRTPFWCWHAKKRSKERGHAWQKHGDSSIVPGKVFLQTDIPILQTCPCSQLIGQNSVSHVTLSDPKVHTRNPDLRLSPQRTSQEWTEYRNSPRSSFLTSACSNGINGQVICDLGDLFWRSYWTFMSRPKTDRLCLKIQIEPTNISNLKNISCHTASVSQFSHIVVKNIN